MQEARSLVDCLAVCLVAKMVEEKDDYWAEKMGHDLVEQLDSHLVDLKESQKAGKWVIHWADSMTDWLVAWMVV